MDLQDAETLSLIHAHAEVIARWRVDTCIPEAILKQKADLRDRAERLHGLVLALTGPAPKPKRQRPPKSKRIPKRRRT